MKEVRVEEMRPKKGFHKRKSEISSRSFTCLWKHDETLETDLTLVEVWIVETAVNKSTDRNLKKEDKNSKFIVVS